MAILFFLACLQNLQSGVGDSKFRSKGIQNIFNFTKTMTVPPPNEVNQAAYCSAQSVEKVRN